MGVKAEQQRLEKSAHDFVKSGQVDSLLRSAMSYAKAKAKARTRRDRWKERKRVK